MERNNKHQGSHGTRNGTIYFTVIERCWRAKGRGVTFGPARCGQLLLT